MCGGEASPGPVALSRRSVLAAAAAAAAAAGAVLLTGSRAVAAAGMGDLGGVAVIPRSEWGGDLVPTGPIPAEPEVRYLLVHHSVDPGNDYAEGDVARILRGFVRFHTSAAKGWPDLAYNFLVDRFGRVWEGRTGSLAGPVAGNATGGNQGFDQLCCFIGNHQAAEPTPEAFTAMSRLLGALAHRLGIAIGDGAMTTFTSRGSNRHAAGTLVTTPTIAGHRDMSQTQCPGDRVAARLPELRLAAAGGSPPARAPAPPAPPSTSAAPATAVGSATTAAPRTTAAPPMAVPATTAPATPAVPGTTAAPGTTAPGTTTAGGGEGVHRSGPAIIVAGVAVATVAVAAGAAVVAARVRAARLPTDAPGPAPDDEGDAGPADAGPMPG